MPTILRRLAVVLVFVLRTRASLAAEAITTIRIPGAATAFASAPQTGAVAIISTPGDLQLYPKLTSEGSLDGVITEKSGTLFRSIAHKRVTASGATAGYFITLAFEGKTLWVLDDRTLQVVKKVPLTGQNPTEVIASLGDHDPYITYANGRGDGSTQVWAPHRVNLVTFKDEGAIDLGREECDDLAVSADGSKLYGRRRGSSPTGVRCWQVEPSPQRDGFIGVILHSEHATRPEYVPDAFGQYVACGKTLFTADMRTIAAELPATPALFLADKPWIIAVDQDQLTVLSYNSLKPLAAAKIPAPADATSHSNSLPKRSSPPRRTDRERTPVVLADSMHHVVLVCAEQSVARVDLAGLALADEPFLYATMEGSTTVVAGEPTKIRIVKQDPRAKMELVSAPAGMTLTGDTLSWTPTTADVGTATARIKLSGARGAERVQKVDIVIRRNSTAVALHPDELKLSHDGKTALLVQYEADGQRQGYNPNSAPFCRVTLVDLSGPAPSVVADRTLSFVIARNAIEVDANYVYLGLQNSDAFLVLSRKDLTDVQRLFTPARVMAIASTGSTAYVGCAENGSRPFHRVVFTVPELKPIDLPEDPMLNFDDGEMLVPRAVGDGWLDRGILYDAALSKPRLVTNLYGFVATGHPMTYYDPNHPRLAQWGMYLQGNKLLRLGGQTIGQLGGRDGAQFGNGQNFAILPDVPLAVGLENKVHADGNVIEGNGSSEHAELQFYDLITGSEVGKAVLADEPTAAQRGQARERRSLVATAPGRVVVVIDQRLFVVPTVGPMAVVDPAKITAPLHFDYRQSVFAIDGSRKETLVHHVGGGTAPLEFVLGAEIPGITIDKTTGAVTIDGAAVAARVNQEIMSAVQNLMGHLASTRPSMLRQDPDGFETGLNEYLARIAPRFEQLAGRRPKGVPVALALDVIVRDKTQATAGMSEVVLVDVPKEPLLAQIRAAETERAQIRARAATQPSRYRPQQADGALRERVIELERENAALRAKVEVLSDLVHGGVGKPPTTQPR